MYQLNKIRKPTPNLFIEKEAKSRNSTYKWNLTSHCMTITGFVAVKKLKLLFPVCDCSVKKKVLGYNCY